jgi:ABC-type branched-subunit amino acid transport system substrate-binding protein
MGRGRKAVWATAAIGAAAAALLDVTACSQSSSPPAAAPEGGTAMLTVGVSDSLTGGLAGLGVGLNQVLTVAAQQINQAGLLGGQIRFDVRDDTSDPTQAQTVVEQLLGEPLGGVLGPLSSGMVNATQALCMQAKVVQISATATSPLLTNAQPKHDRYFFRTCPPDDLQGRAIVKFIRDGVAAIGPGTGDAGSGDASPGDGGAGGTIGGTCRVAYVVNGNDTYGSALGDVVQQVFPNGAGTRIAGRDSVPTTLQSNYSTVVGHVVAAHPDCLVLIAYSDVGAELLRELKTAIAADTAHDWSRFFVSGSDGEYDSKFIPDGQSDPSNPKSPNSTAGCYGTTVDPAPDTPAFRAFRAIWQQWHPGTEPPAYGANQYDAAVVLALAIEQAGSATDGPKIRDALYQVANPPGTAYGPDQFVDAINAISKGQDIDYTGASGNCDFDDYGNVTDDYIVWQVQQQADGTYAFATVGKIKSSELPQ